MRPISKGKNNKKFNEYSQARGDLIDRLGQYCSYCEMKVTASLSVEHVQPKSHHPELRCEWDNFLLACTNCNSTKGDSKIRLKDYLWPDRDNTFLAFVYMEGEININGKLEKHQKGCAQNILDLVGLQKRPGSKDLKASDRRWRNRREAWETASLSLKRLIVNDTEALREQIVVTAYLGGHWSIWMTVFKEDDDMLKRFLAKFPGTCKECFDEMGRPIPRESGMV